MKKLMIAAAIVCAAAFAQAASIDWTCAARSFYKYGTDGSTTKQGDYRAITSYLLVFDSEGGSAALQASLADGSVTFAQAISTYSVGSAVGSDSTSSKSAGMIDTTMPGAGKTTSLLTAGQQAYFAMFSIGDETHFLLSQQTVGTPYASEPDEGVAAKFQGSNFDMTKTDVQGSWSAVNVPEPTSAMLLLLGVAGLALKRKRA